MTDCPNSNPYWTYKLFRAFEYVFGRKEGIKRELTKSLDGKFYQAHSLEALLTLAEIALRNIPKLDWPVKVWIPKLSSPVGLPNRLPFLFAIAFDATGNSINPSSNHTITGSNPILFATVQSVTNDVTTCTYNSVGSSGSYNLVISGTNVIKAFYWLAPATGLHSVAVSGGTNVQGFSSSYSGASQTSVDSENSGISATNPITVTTTVVASNCWLYWSNGFVGTDAGGTSASPGGASRGAVGLAGFRLDVGDSGGTVGTGSQSEVITVTVSVLTELGAIVISFAPASSGHNLLLMGIGT